MQTEIAVLVYEQSLDLEEMFNSIQIYIYVKNWKEISGQRLLHTHNIMDRLRGRQEGTHPTQ